MTDDTGQTGTLPALAKRLGLDPEAIDPHRVLALMASSQPPEDTDADAFDSTDSTVDAQDFEPAKTGPDGVPLYPSREAAQTAADAMGLDGTHEMDDPDGDGVMYAPGASHEAAVDAIQDDPDDGQADASQVDVDDLDLEAQATGTIDAEAALADAGVSFDVDQVRLEADGSTLAGIIWGAGDHDLALGGKPTPVRVPQATIPDTFERLKDDLQAGDVTIGFDHPDPDSVAAQTGIVDIGQATAAALTADERFIALTDSELTNQQAVEAAEAGDFDDLDWSVVADVSVRRDDDGQPVTEDGRVVLDATRIRRIDAVDDGAVDQASITRTQAALPDLKDEVQTVQDAAEAGLNQTDTDAVVTALKASATAYNDITEMQDINPDDVDDIEAARTQLSAAADIIDEQEQELEAAQAQATAFEGLLSAHDVDADSFDDPAEAAQAVIDDQTEDVRQDIADLEAGLAAFDTDEDDVDDRVDALAGRSPTELENLLNARKAKAFEVQQAKQSRGVAAAQDDQVGTASFAGGQQADDGEANDIALSAMDGSDRIQAHSQGLDPADFVSQEYGLTAAEYDNADELHDDIMAAMTGEN